MSTGFLKKPSRPPPAPPIDGHHRSFSNSLSRGLAVASSSASNRSATLATPSHRKSSSSSGKSRSDYIKISECHTGLPDRPLGKPAGFKSRASTSFSSTLKPSSSSDHYLQSSHQKSRSLTENHLSSTYLYLDLPSTTFESVSGGRNGSSTLGKNHALGSSRRSNNLSFSDDHHSSNNVSSTSSSSNNNNHHNNNNHEAQHVSTVYKTVDFMKTDALNKCKVERTSGRGSDLKGR